MIFILIFDELYPHKLDQHFKVVENYFVEYNYAFLQRNIGVTAGLARSLIIVAKIYFYIGSESFLKTFIYPPTHTHFKIVSNVSEMSINMFSEDIFEERTRRQELFRLGVTNLACFLIVVSISSPPRCSIAL